jgi:hypothetical protein
MMMMMMVMMMMVMMTSKSYSHRGLKAGVGVDPQVRNR